MRLRLWRSLVPSWKFFEDIGHTPVLFYRVSEQDHEWSEWQQFHHPLARKPWNLFFNPELNLQLAEKSILQQAISDQSTVSLKMIADIIDSRLPSSVQIFQFKISIYAEQDWEEVYLSEELERA